MTDIFSENSFLEINTEALLHNLKVLNDFLPASTGQMAVIKANAYGHGAVAVAKILEDHVGWFAVNDVDEGIELREAGIERPVLVFGVPAERTAPAYPRYRLTATISGLSHFDLLSDGTAYHLNIDSGMGRLGLDQDQIPQTKKEMRDYPQLECTGIYSHFATADDPDSEKAYQQLQTFKSIRSRFDPDLLTHMANTGGTAFYPDSHFDMVRNGIGLYGYAPGSEVIEGLKPVMSWRSHLVQVKPVKKGTTVSYGARWTAPEDGFIGVIPVGYEEGVPRILSGNLEVDVAGNEYPIVGTVTMNYIMVYLGVSTRFKPGAPVEVLGENALTASTWADRAGTIPYEIVSNMSARLSRKY